MLGRTALFAAVLAIVAFPMSAAGELQPNDISRAGVSGSTPRIASDGSGNIVAVWRELDGDTSAVGAAFRPAGGAWSSAQRISEPAAATESPKLAMDALGNAVAVWQRSTGHDSVVQAAVRPAGGDWSDPQDLSAPSEVAFNADVAIRAGRATAVLDGLDDRRTTIETSSRAIEAPGRLGDDLRADRQRLGAGDRGRRGGRGRRRLALVGRRLPRDQAAPDPIRASGPRRKSSPGPGAAHPSRSSQWTRTGTRS